MSAERALLAITHEDGLVLMKVQETIIQLDPAAARKLATSLFIKAANAEGVPVPELVILPSS